MVRRCFSILSIFALLLCLGAAPEPALSNLAQDDINSGRAKILAFMLRQHLPRHHFSHKPLDDELSRAAFDLYLKQIDNQKRLLLAEDVRRLRQYETGIDDEILKSDMKLPALVRELMVKRMGWARKTVAELFDAGFDFERHEFLLTDPEKLDFCTTEEELRDRWRKILKLQVINRYLSLEDDLAATAGDDGTASAEKDRSPKELIAEATEKVRKSFDEYFSRMEKETFREQYDRYFDAVSRAYDPHTNYMPPATKEDFDISMRGSLEGIGATLRQEDGYVKVVRIVPGSAAYRQGQLEAEDTILKVAQGAEEPVDITDMTLRKAVGLIRGKKGTEVRLTVRKPDGKGLVIPIIRDVVEIQDAFVKSAVLEDPASGAKFGYIRIPSFYRDFDDTGHGGTGRNSTDDVRAALEGFTGEGISGVILDLRSNGGGALTDAVQITGLFIDEGPVVQVRDSSGGIRIKEDTEPGTSYGGPLVVVVNRFSASASEILAGALQDYGRALLIGSSHTHGKGTVQTMIDLNQSGAFPNMDAYRPLGALKVTIQKFYRVSGESTQYRGVVPDIVLPDLMEYLETGERYLDNSLPWDTVAKAGFSPWHASGIDRNSVVARSAERVEHNNEFARIGEQALKSKERRDRSLQSLHITTIREEREEQKKEAEIGKDNPHAEGEGGTAPGGKMSEEERRIQWRNNLEEDPYVIEGIAVLGDMIRSPATAHVGTGASAATP